MANDTPKYYMIHPGELALKTYYDSSGRKHFGIAHTPKCANYNPKREVFDNVK